MEMGTGTDNINHAADRWTAHLLELYSVNELSQLPKQVITEEISMAKAAIENCKIWADEYGVSDNTRYITLLEEALYANQQSDIIAYVADQLSEKMEEYEVEITETYQRKIKVIAPNDKIAIKTVRKAYESGDIILTADYYVDAEFSLVGEVWVNHLI